MMTLNGFLSSLLLSFNIGCLCVCVFVASCRPRILTGVCR